MANKLYTQLSGVVTKLTKQFGNSSVTFYAPSMLPSEDPNTPGTGDEVDETQWPKATVKAVLSKFARKQVDGDHIMDNDIMLLCGSADPGWGTVDPEKVNWVEIEGVRYDCALVDHIKPGDVSLALTFRAR